MGFKLPWAGVTPDPVLRYLGSSRGLDTRVRAPEFGSKAETAKFGEIMQYSKLGKTGITVSRICLGCMSYGDKKWRDWVLTMDEAREHFAAAVESGINFYDTAERLFRRRERGGHRAMARRDGQARRDRRRDQSARADGVGAQSRGPQPQKYSRGVRRVAAPAQDGFHRPLSNPSLRLHDADRRDARGARLAGARRQGALPRRELDGGVAIRQGARASERKRMASVRLDAEPLQPRLSRGGARDESALHRQRRRR